MSHKKKSHSLIAASIVFVAMLLGLFFVGVVLSNLGLEEKDAVLGATFSKSYAEHLGLDWKETYTAALDDLGLRHLRIPAYWDDIQPSPTKYDFANIDWQIDEAAKRKATVILAVGRKLPRWPECHVPGWAKEMDETEIRKKILVMLETTVKRYRNDPAIVAWQVENEPFFSFGLCPEPDRAFLKQEIAVVRSIDNRPIMVTESGELSTWLNAASVGDILGISTYRVVWNRYIGYFFWPITPRYYTGRIEAVRSLVDKIVVSELQAEPWIVGSIESQPIDEQLKIMNPERLDDNISFARRIGLSEIYLWGIEWWYWLKSRGQPEMWEAGKSIIRRASFL